MGDINTLKQGKGSSIMNGKNAGNDCITIHTFSHQLYKHGHLQSHAKSGLD